MNELIPINYENDQPTVSARELHEFLEVGTLYKDWFPRMCDYGFAENEDFNLLKNERVQNEGGRMVSRMVEDAQLTIDMAKELCMIQRNEKGKQARQYFLSIEKAWNDPATLMARALKLADKKIINLTEQIQHDAPKVLFADAVAASKTSILVGELAKLISQNGVDIGQNRLFAWMRENGYLIRRQGTDYNMPTQYSMDLGLFEIKETSISHSDGHTTIHKTPKVSGKGQQYFVGKFIHPENMPRISGEK